MLCMVAKNSIFFGFKLYLECYGDGAMLKVPQA